MDVIKPLIEGNKVAVFSKTYCPYCTKAKSALEGACTLRVGELGQASNTRNRVCLLKAWASPRAPTRCWSLTTTPAQTRYVSGPSLS